MRKKFVRYTTYKEFLPGDFDITSKINPTYKYCDRSRKEKASITSARASIRRAHKNLFEVLRSNVWTYFITLTFGFDGLDADEQCRKAFSKWSKDMRSLFPSMYYVAVPEYHKKGDLHYHLVVGGVTADQLGLVYSGRVLHKGKAWRESDFYRRGFVADVKTGEGARIFNVTAWLDGFSTCTEVRSSDAVAKYVGKYLTKVDLDPRFYNKRRFHTSHNISKPTVKRFAISDTYTFNDQGLISDGLVPTYENPYRHYRSYGLAEIDKEDIIRLRLLGLLPMPTRDLPFDTE